MQKKNPVFCIRNLNTFLSVFEGMVNEKFLTLPEINRLLISSAMKTKSTDNYVNGQLISLRSVSIT